MSNCGTCASSVAMAKIGQAGLQCGVPDHRRIAAAAFELVGGVVHLHAADVLRLDQRRRVQAGPVGVGEIGDPPLLRGEPAGRAEVREGPPLPVLVLVDHPVPPVPARVLRDVLDPVDQDVRRLADLAAVTGQLGRGQHHERRGRRDLGQPPVVGDRDHVVAGRAVRGRERPGRQVPVALAGVRVQRTPQPGPGQLKGVPDGAHGPASRSLRARSISFLKASLRNHPARTKVGFADRCVTRRQPANPALPGLTVELSPAAGSARSLTCRSFLKET